MNSVRLSTILIRCGVETKTKKKKKVNREREWTSPLNTSHADTLLILKCAVALCVTRSNYKTGIALCTVLSAAARMLLNDVLSKR